MNNSTFKHTVLLCVAAGVVAISANAFACVGVGVDCPSPDVDKLEDSQVSTLHHDKGVNTDTRGDRQQ